MEEVRSEVSGESAPQPSVGGRDATPAEVAAMFLPDDYVPPEQAAKKPERPEIGLEIFGPEIETLKTSIGDLVIGPMRMGTIAEFLKVATKLLPAIKEQLTTSAEINMTTAMTADPEGMFAAVAIASGTTPEKLKEMYPEEFIRVATKVIVVNVDFFIRVLPMALGMAQANVVSALQRLLSAGVTPSKN
jgi:hypothetical protein